MASKIRRTGEGVKVQTQVAGKLGFYGAAPVAKQTITTSTGTEAQKITRIADALTALGLIAQD
jgi:hypothetical protein